MATIAVEKIRHIDSGTLDVKIPQENLDLFEQPGLSLTSKTEDPDAKGELRGIRRNIMFFVAITLDNDLLFTLF